MVKIISVYRIKFGLPHEVSEFLIIKDWRGNGLKPRNLTSFCKYSSPVNSFFRIFLYTLKMNYDIIS